MDRKKSSGCGLWALVPLGFVALLFLRQMLPWISRILLTLLGIAVCLAVALIVLVIYFSKNSNRDKENLSQEHKEAQKDPASSATEKPPEENYCTLEQMQILNKGRSHLMELRGLATRIRDLNVRKRSEDICAEIERILNVLQKQPEDIDRVRQFFNYYLPTLGSILMKYLRLEEGDVVGDSTTVKVMSCLREIRSAMEKQYMALYDNDLVDLTVEMEALTLACKRDGLLVNEEFTLREGEREISLTL